MPEILAPIADWLNSFTALTAVLVIIAVLYLIRMLWRGAKAALPGVRAALTFVEALFELPVFMSDMRKQVQEIRHEVLPNNGGSLRDDVETLTLMAEQQGLKLTQLEKHDEVDHARLGVLEDTIGRRRTIRADIQQGASEEIPVFPSDTGEE